MLTLGVDSSSEVGAVGLADENGILGEINIKLVHRHSKELLSIIDYLFKQTGRGVKELEGIAVSVGPGSFTGLRIGLSTVKTFAQVLQIPVIGLSSLDILAYNLNLAKNWLIPIIDARRDRVYTAIYKRWDQDIISQKVSEDRALHIETLIEEINTFDTNGVVNFIGNSELINSNHFKGGKIEIKYSSINNSIPRGGAVAELGQFYLKNGKSDNYLELIPNYLKKPQAEINWLKKHG